MHGNYSILTTTGFLYFIHHEEFKTLENITFQKLDLLPSSDEERETPTLLGPSSLLILGTDPVSKTPCFFFVLRIPNDGQSPATQKLWVLHDCHYPLNSTSPYWSVQRRFDIKKYTWHLHLFRCFAFSHFFAPHL
jgi:hypothetical protein